METAVPLRRNDIADGLRRLGLGAGDHVLVHTSLASFGTVEGGAGTVIDALLDVVGIRGTVMVPTFGSPDPVFDPATSETSLGAVPSAFWKRSGALRSSHPLASVAAIGDRAAWLLQGHVGAETAHGEGTPYHRLVEIGGKILLLGVDQDRSTFLHTAEEVARLPYLRPHAGSYRDGSGAVVTQSWPFFPGPHRAFIGIQAWLEDKGLCRKTAIGSCMAQLMSCRGLLDALLERLRDEPGLFITPNPALPDGIWQRAAILAAELERERFTLAADSQHAGTTMEEIIRSVTAAGIRSLLLSSIGGTPWASIEEPWRRWYLQGLALAGIAVRGIRLARLDPDSAGSLARDAGTDTVVVPSTVPAASIAATASRGLRVLVQNLGIGGAEAVRVVRSPELAGRSVGIAFDPLAFLAVGENPFLTTYSKSRIRLHTALLYVADGLPTGERAQVGEGLAEVAELLSMLRASRYSGLVVLQSPSPASFGQSAERFMALLRSLGRPV